MTELSTLKLRVERLEQIINDLTGSRENGPITMRQAREALEKGDKLPWAKFCEQESRRFMELKRETQS